MSKSVICIAQTEKQAGSIIDRLKEAGINESEVSILLPDRSGTRDFAYEHHTKAPEGTTLGVSAGGATGGILGWLAGIGSLAIPGVGPFIAAGPIMAALGGAAVGAIIGGIGGALIGFGIPEYEAKQYETKIRGGNILISVHADNGQIADLVCEIYESCDAEDISSTAESRVSSSRRGDRKSHQLFEAR